MAQAALVLGSGQDGGSPQLGRTGGVGPDRTASCVAVVSPLGSVILLDITPDIRHQGRRLLEWRGYPNGRSTFIDGIAITHAHMGHYAGLVHFGREAMASSAVPLWGTPSMLGYLTVNEPWASLFDTVDRAGLPAVPHLSGIPFTTSVPVDDSLTIRPIHVAHRAEFTDTVAISVEIDDDPWLLYLPDIDDWDGLDDVDEVVGRHGVALLDATFASADELMGRAITDIPHPLVPDTIDRFRDLTDSTTIVLTHINHSNPLADPRSSIHALAVDAGFIVATDGLALEG
ncbi:MAG: hypothetical protein KDB69_03215 [Acidimicrobiia bacterium]|nr:hypothetical protein [Acidimicrobiia bacterium]